MGVEAEELLELIAPIILRINVDVVDLDRARIGSGSKFSHFKLKAMTTELCFRYNDNLDLHAKQLYVLKRNGEYECLYKRGDIVLHEADKRFDETCNDFRG